uniref:Ig-like domain-containing protein n=1 Tax=Plectus sambesii TaxID=2011161 RepID=A0A914VF69_9BILA
MNEQLGRLCLALCLLHAAVVAGEPCFDSTTVHYEGEVWIYRENLKVVCKKGEIVPLSCVTALGTIIPLGTVEFQENDVTYSCVLDEAAYEVDADGSGSGEEELLAVGQPRCTTKTVGQEWSEDTFAYRCVDEGVTKIVGCLDDGGRVVGHGQAFVTDVGILKVCRIAKNGQEARVENKGCFIRPENSEDFDLTDTKSLNYRKKYGTWRIGDIEYRCGDQGIYAYKCFIEIKGKPRAIYSGSSWLDSTGMVQFCG